MKKNIALIGIGLILSILIIILSTHIRTAIGAPLLYALLLGAFGIFGTGVALLVKSKNNETNTTRIMLVIAVIGLASCVASRIFPGPILMAISMLVNSITIAYAVILFASRLQKKRVVVIPEVD